MMPPCLRHRVLGAALCATGLVLAGAAVVRTVDAPPVDLPAVHLSGTVASRAAPPDRPRPSGSRPVSPPTAPVQLDLPSIGAHARVVPVAVDRDGGLSVPDDPAVVGWWSDGGKLADPGAALVLDGHVDTAARGLGALFHLVDLAPGDALSITGADGAARRFRVTAVRAYPKAALPRDVFQPADRLVIVTCGGHFDRRALQYADNVVAYADPV